MRLLDMNVLRKAANKFEKCPVVRISNPESRKFIGKPGYQPKELTCKAKTAHFDVVKDGRAYQTAGLVVDPTIHPEAFREPEKAIQEWEAAKVKFEQHGYRVSVDQTSRHYGCLQHNGEHIHSDLDLFDLVDMKRPRANLAVAGTLHGEDHFHGPAFTRVRDFVNREAGADLIQHGAQAQAAGMKLRHDDELWAFPPNQDPIHLKNPKEIRAFYRDQFQGRKVLYEAPHRSVGPEGPPRQATPPAVSPDGLRLSVVPPYTASLAAEHHPPVAPHAAPLPNPAGGPVHHGLLYEPLRAFNRTVESIPHGSEGLQQGAAFMKDLDEDTKRDWDLTRSPDQGLKIMANVITSEGIPLGPAKGVAGAIEKNAARTVEKKAVETLEKDAARTIEKNAAATAEKDAAKTVHTGGQGEHIPLPDGSGKPGSGGFGADHKIGHIWESVRDVPRHRLVEYADHLAAKERAVVTTVDEGHRIVHCISIIEKDGDPSTRKILITSSALDIKRDLYIGDKGLRDLSPGTKGALVEKGPTTYKVGKNVFKLDAPDKPDYHVLTKKEVERLKAQTTKAGVAQGLLSSYDGHHAEVKAYEWADKNGYKIVAMAPTQACCDSCREYLKAEGRLGKDFEKVVPTNRQSDAAFKAQRDAEDMAARLTPGPNLGRGELARQFPGNPPANGGPVLGEYQLTVRRQFEGQELPGTAQKFLESKEAEKWKQHFGIESSIDQNGVWKEVDWKNVAEHWRELENRDPAFRAAQHDYVQKHMYGQEVWSLADRHMVDVEHRSHALQNAVWSAALEHSGSNRVTVDALAKEAKRLGVRPEKLTDEDCIRAIYKERIHRFGNQEGAAEYAKRCYQERDAAMKMLADERTAPLQSWSVPLPSETHRPGSGGFGGPSQANGPGGSQRLVANMMAQREEAATWRTIGDANKFLHKINADRGQSNCQSCTIATFERFHGRPVVSTADHAPPDDAFMEWYFQSRFRKAEGGLNEVVQHLRDAGPGNTCVLRCQKDGASHVMLAANVDGRVILMDGQMGIAMRPQDLPGNWTKFDYMPTSIPKDAKPVLGLDHPPPPPPGGGRGGGAAAEAARTGHLQPQPPSVHQNPTHAAALPAEFNRGSLSQKYESGGNPGSVSSGYLNKAHTREDRGGVSYGAYQFTSRYIDKHGQVHEGTVQSFLKSREGQRWAPEFRDAQGNPLKAATPEFSARWKEIANREPQEFKTAQHAYIERNFYQVQAQHVRKTTGVDPEHRSRTLQNAVWSTAVQHGAGSDIVKDALQREAARQHVHPSQLSDEACLRAIYRQRTEKFPATESRYASEYRAALGMLQSEKLLKGQPANQFEADKRKALLQIEREVKDLRERQHPPGGKFVADAKGQERLAGLIEQVRKQGYLDVSTPPNGSVFHDGFKSKADPMGSRFRATEFCLRPENAHCRTLETTPGGSWLAAQDLNRGVLSGARSAGVWQNLSHDFTQQARGHVQVFAAPDSAAHAGGKAVEQAIRANPNVTAIETHPGDRGSSLSFTQSAGGPPVGAAAAGAPAAPRVHAAPGSPGSQPGSSQPPGQQGSGQQGSGQHGSGQQGPGQFAAQAAQPRLSGFGPALKSPSQLADAYMRAEKADTGRDTDERTARRLSLGRDPVTGAAPFFRGPIPSNYEEWRRDAAEYASRKQREQAEKEQRLDNIVAERQAREDQAARDFQRDVKQGKRLEDEEKKAAKQEHKAEEKEHHKEEEKAHKAEEKAAEDHKKQEETEKAHKADEKTAEDHKKQEETEKTHKADEKPGESDKAQKADGKTAGDDKKPEESDKAQKADGKTAGDDKEPEESDKAQKADGKTAGDDKKPEEADKAQKADGKTAGDDKKPEEADKAQKADGKTAGDDKKPEEADKAQKADGKTAGDDKKPEESDKAQKADGKTAGDDKKPEEADKAQKADGKTAGDDKKPEESDKAQKADGKTAGDDKKPEEADKAQKADGKTAGDDKKPEESDKAQKADGKTAGDDKKPEESDKAQKADGKTAGDDKKPEESDKAQKADGKTAGDDKKPEEADKAQKADGKTAGEHQQAGQPEAGKPAPGQPKPQNAAGPAAGKPADPNMAPAPAPGQPKPQNAAGPVAGKSADPNTAPAPAPGQPKPQNAAGPAAGKPADPNTAPAPAPGQPKPQNAAGPAAGKPADPNTAPAPAPGQPKPQNAAGPAAGKPADPNTAPAPAPGQPKPQNAAGPAAGKPADPNMAPAPAPGQPKPQNAAGPAAGKPADPNTAPAPAPGQPKPKTPPGQRPGNPPIPTRPLHRRPVSPSPKTPPGQRPGNPPIPTRPLHRRPVSPSPKTPPVQRPGNPAIPTRLLHPRPVSPSPKAPPVQRPGNPPIPTWPLHRRPVSPSPKTPPGQQPGNPPIPTWHLHRRQVSPSPKTPPGQRPGNPPIPTWHLHRRQVSPSPKAPLVQRPGNPPIPTWHLHRRQISPSPKAPLVHRPGNPPIPTRLLHRRQVSPSPKAPLVQRPGNPPIPTRLLHRRQVSPSPKARSGPSAGKSADPNKAPAPAPSQPKLQGAAGPAAGKPGDPNKAPVPAAGQPKPQGAAGPAAGKPGDPNKAPAPAAGQPKPQGASGPAAGKSADPNKAPVPAAGQPKPQGASGPSTGRPASPGQSPAPAAAPPRPGAAANLAAGRPANPGQSPAPATGQPKPQGAAGPAAGKFADPNMAPAPAPSQPKPQNAAGPAAGKPADPNMAPAPAPSQPKPQGAAGPAAGKPGEPNKAPVPAAGQPKPQGAAGPAAGKPGDPNKAPAPAAGQPKPQGASGPWAGKSADPNKAPVPAAGQPKPQGASGPSTGRPASPGQSARPGSRSTEARRGCQPSGWKTG